MEGKGICRGKKCLACFYCQRGKQAFSEGSQHGGTFKDRKAFVGCTATEGAWNENALQVGCILFNSWEKEERENWYLLRLVLDKHIKL